MIGKLEGKMKYLIFALLFLIGCSSNADDSVPSLSGAIQLVPILEDTELDSFTSTNIELTIAYPKGWAIVEGDNTIYLASEESFFPWKKRSSIAQPLYSIHIIGPYVDRRNQRWRIPQPTLEVVQKIADSWNAETLRPIMSNDINGMDGASLLLGDEAGQIYMVYLRLTEHRLVSLSASGPTNKSEEMQAVINTIALNTRLAEN